MHRDQSSTHQDYSSINRNKSPRRDYRSPHRRSRSPRRYERSPRRYEISPKRHDNILLHVDIRVMIDLLGVINDLPANIIDIDRYRSIYPSPYSYHSRRSDTRRAGSSYRESSKGQAHQNVPNPDISDDLTPVPSVPARCDFPMET